MARGIARKFGWVLLGVALVAVVALAGAYAWARAVVSRDLRASAAQVEAAIARHREAFLADEATAAAHPALAVRAGDRDAGPFLNPRLPWDASPAALDAWRRTLPRDTPSLALDEARAAKPKEWSWKTPPDLWRGLDFGWMAGLAAYDRWDLDVASPRTRPAVPYWDAPLPRFGTLVAWSRLRLAKGIAEGRPAEAAAEVADVARLLLGTENVVGVLAGIEVLAMNERAREASGAPPGAWPGLDAASAAAARRAARGAIAFFAIDTPERFAADAARIRFARCAAIEEAVRVETYARPLLAPARPEAYARLGRTLDAARDCRLVRLRRVWAEGAARRWGREDACGAEPARGLADRAWCEVQLVALRVPPLRALYGDWLAALGGPDWLEAYGHAPPRKAAPDAGAGR